MKPTSFVVSVFILLNIAVSTASAHNSYTGGYSGASGASCAASCHATTAGTLTVSGIPQTYVPGRTYTITVGHNGGSQVINFNATTRLGTTSTVAGTFATNLNTSVFTGTDGGVFASPHLIDSAKFLWTAPASGKGTVNFYIAGMQGTSTGSKNGSSTKLTRSVTESTTGVGSEAIAPESPLLLVNYPNPFNPSTTIEFSTPKNGPVRLSIMTVDGRKVADVYQGFALAGRRYQVYYTAAALASGNYYCVLESVGARTVKRMTLLK